jgi:hypothetical protein
MERTRIWLKSLETRNNDHDSSDERQRFSIESRLPWEKETHVFFLLKQKVQLIHVHWEWKGTSIRRQGEGWSSFLQIPKSEGIPKNIHQKYHGMRVEGKKTDSWQTDLTLVFKIFVVQDQKSPPSSSIWLEIPDDDRVTTTVTRISCDDDSISANDVRISLQEDVEWVIVCLQEIESIELEVASVWRGRDYR